MKHFVKKSRVKAFKNELRKRAAKKARGFLNDCDVKPSLLRGRAKVTVTLSPAHMSLSDERGLDGETETKRIWTKDIS